MPLQVVQEKNFVSSKVKIVVAVGAGKGGVGKSTVAVNLSLALKKIGKKVGILDADIYGPSLVQMLPEGLAPLEEGGNIFPALSLGMPFISMGHFHKNASIVRAPVANSIIDRFLQRVQWGELDFLIIDFPPGTGDIQLTLMQKGFISVAVVVTTPQIVSLIDVRKTIQMFEKMHIPVLGIIENMSYFFEPKSEEKMFLFGQGAAEKLAQEFCLPILGMVPLDPLLSQSGDLGLSLFETHPQSSVVEIFQNVAKQILIKSFSISLNQVQVVQNDAFHLTFTFFQENAFTLSLAEIQKNCPCARCQSKERKTLDPHVSLLEFSFVGRYALRIQFSSGCSSGLYPFSLIKKTARL